MKKNFWILLVIVVVIMAAAIVLFVKPNHVSQVMQTPLKVRLQAVVKHNIPLTVQAVGTVVAPQTIMLQAKQAGSVVSVHFKSGQWVSKNALLVQIEDQVQKANLAQMQALYAQAKIKYQRYVDLQKQDKQAVSKEMMDELFAAMQAAHAKALAAKQALLQCQVRAPFSGYVGSLTSVPNTVASDDHTFENLSLVSVGSYLTLGSNIVILSNPDKVVVQYQVPQEQSAYLKLGQSVTINSTAYPDQTFKGQVDYISPIVYQSSRAFEVRAAVANKKHLLKSGMNMIVSQVLEKNRKVLAVPGLSLVPSFAGYNVYSVEKGKVQLLPVKVGERYGTWVVVESGLSAGQKIIVSDVGQVEPGNKAQVMP